MRVTHVRPAPPQPLPYRLALALHVRHDLDSALAHVDLMALDRSSVRELILGIERSTGLSTGSLIHDAQLEEDAD